MKRTIIFLGILFITLAHVRSQSEILLAKDLMSHLVKHNLDIDDTTHIYVGDGNSTEVFYYALKPNGKIQSALILLPPTAQSVEDVINHNLELARVAHEAGILVVIPSINYNLGLDTLAIQFINTALGHVIEQYDPPQDKIVLGGFSLGGMNALRYTEMAYCDPAATVIKPAGVYGVDPPLDFARLYYSFKHAIEANFSQPAVYEAEVYLEKLHRQFGGSPVEHHDIYVKYSMYSRGEFQGGNAICLKDVPVRIYSDPDIDWHLEQRHVDYYDMNALDQAALINQLNRLGNDDAEYVNVLGKGYRLDGRRHPHSWSLVDPEECVEWMKGVTK